MSHPIIGKILSVVLELLSNANDSIYNFEEKDKWGNWQAESKLFIAAWWPITAPVGLTFNILALVYGILIKGLFS